MEETKKQTYPEILATFFKQHPGEEFTIKQLKEKLDIDEDIQLNPALKSLVKRGLLIRRYTRENIKCGFMNQYLKSVEVVKFRLKKEDEDTVSILLELPESIADRLILLGGGDRDGVIIKAIQNFLKEQEAV